MQDPKSPVMTVYTNKTDDLGWYVVEVTATLEVYNLLGDLDPSNDPDHTPAFLNTWLKDPVTGQKIYGKEKLPPNFIYNYSFNVTVGVIQVNTTSVT